MRILALDTSTAACSVALISNDGFLKKRFTVTPREHEKQILPMVDSLLSEACIDLKDLDLLAFGRGPGNFTGIRIGMSIAQGLALGAEISLIGISTLATLAEGAWRRTGSKKILTLLDARMGEYYGAHYRRQHDGSWLGDDSETIITLSELEVWIGKLHGNWATAGTGWLNYSPSSLVCTNRLRLISGNSLLPSAQDILTLAQQQWMDDVQALSSKNIEPIYLRSQVV